MKLSLKKVKKVNFFNKGPNRKGKQQSNQKLEKVNCLKKKKVIPKIAM